MADYKIYEDQELIEEMRGGEEYALVEIYERYWEKMLAVAFNRLGNLEDAEECVQDVLYKLWALRDNLVLEKTELSNYLARAIRNQSFNILDRRHRERLKAEGYLTEKIVGPLSPEHLMIMRELQEQVDQAIHSLPPQCQLVFRLNRQEGLSKKEIAEKLQLSENTVKSHLKKANKDIKGNTDLLITLVFAHFLFF